MTLTLQVVGQTPALGQVYSATKEGKLLTAFDEELLGLLQSADERFESDSKRHLVVDLAVLRSIDSQKLAKATDQNSINLRKWLIGRANIEKARRFGHDVEDPKVASQKLGDLKVPDFNTLQKGGVFGIRARISGINEVDHIVSSSPAHLTSPAGLTVQLTFSTALAEPIRTPVWGNNSSRTSASSIVSKPKLRVLPERRDQIIRDLGYDPVLIAAEFVDGARVFGDLKQGEKYNVLLLNSHNSRDGEQTKAVKFKNVEFFEQDRVSILFLGGRDNERTLPVYLQERHYVILREPKTLPRASSLYFDRRYTQPQVLKSSLNISNVGMPIMLRSDTSFGESEESLTFSLETKVKKLDPDKTYLFLRKGEKPQVGSPDAYFTTRDRRNGSAVTIFTKEGGTIQILSNRYSYLLAIPLELNQGPALDEAKLFDEIDTARRLGNESMPNESDLKIALGISSAPTGISHSIPSPEDKSEKDRWPADMRGWTSSVGGRNEESFQPYSAEVSSANFIDDTSTPELEDRIMRTLENGESVNFIELGFNGGNFLSDAFGNRLNTRFKNSEALLNGEVVMVQSVDDLGVRCKSKADNIEFAFWENINQLQILGKADDGLVIKPNESIADIFLAKGHPDYEIREALVGGKVVDFSGVDSLNGVDSDLNGFRILFNGKPGAIVSVQPHGIDLNLDGVGYEYKFLDQGPFKLQLLRNETKASADGPRTITVERESDYSEIGRNLLAGHTLMFPAGVGFWRQILDEVHRLAHGRAIQINGETLRSDHSTYVIGNHFHSPENNGYYQVRNGSLTLKIVD